jgi:hypothetical protein
MYPEAWRREFGAEFEELLERWPLSVPGMLNVMAGALSEQVNDLFRRLRGGGKMSDRMFGARYDRFTMIVSGLVSALLIAVPVMAVRTGAAAAFVGLVSAMVIVVTFAFSPRGYEISGGTFRVKRLISDVVFPLDELRFVRDTTAADFRGCVRLWGSGGLFGYYGWFWSKALGRSRWYVTDLNKAIVVTDGDQVILVSPADDEGFVMAIQPAGAGTRSENSLFASGGPASSPAIGLAIAGVVAVALVAAGMLYAPGRPPVDLTQDSLVIHSRFYGTTVPASSVDAANVRVVDLMVDVGWKPVTRTNGVGNPFYQAGNFRVANGMTVKLFTTGAKRLVLLPPSREGGQPVLLDMAAPDQFAARVREEWRGR